MGVPEARLSRSRKGSRLSLNSTRLKDVPGDSVSFPDSAPSSPELKNEIGSPCSFSLDPDSPKTVDVSCHSAEKDLCPPFAPVASFFNLGNTCFMNCMLHVLRYTPEFLQLLTSLRDEIDREEKTASDEETKPDKSGPRTAWQLLKSLHDMYTEMSLKEFQYKQLLSTNSTSMALRPYTVLDNIRLLNSLFEGNIQHDAQELLRCILCGLDDAELELRQVKQKRREAEENVKKLPSNSGDAYGCASLGVSATVKEEGRESVHDAVTSCAGLSATRGRRRGGKKKENVSAASKGILASFLKAKEAPGIITKVEEPCEPFEGADLDKDVLTVDKNEISVGVGDNQIASNATSFLSAPSSPCSISSSENSSVSDVIFCGESKTVSLTSPQLESRRLVNNVPSSLSHSQETYLHSVKYTEGRRSRLGVRGKKACIKPDNKSSLLSNDGLPDSCPIAADPSKIDIFEGNCPENFTMEKISRLDKVQGSPKKQDFTIIKGSSPQSHSSNVALHAPPLADEEIAELPPSIICSGIRSSNSSKIDEFPTPESIPDPERENDNVIAINGNFSHLLLTPGKEITVHSPMVMKKPGFYTPPTSKPRNFLSRLGSFLPSSAKRFISFSSDDSHCVATKPSTASPPSDVDNLKKRPLPVSALDSESTSDKFSKKELDEHLREAQVQLKRCDWLGVSPVKSVSATYVMNQILDTKEDASMNSGKEQPADTYQDSQNHTQLRKRLFDGTFVSSNHHEVIEDKNDINSINQNENKEDGDTLLCSSSRTGCRQPVNKEAVSGNPPRPKRFKSSAKAGQKNDRSVDLAIKCQKLPKLSINLEKCDWLINPGMKSVKVSSTRVESTEVKNKDSKIAFSQNSDLNGKFIHDQRNQTSSLASGDNIRTDLSTGKTTPRLVHNLFGGTMSHQTRCCECEAISDRSEEFLDISIPVPKATSCSDDDSDEESCGAPSDSSVSLLLQSLASRERIYGENKYFCENCHHLVEAERSSHITALPKVLALHLKRFHANSSAFGGVSKISDHVAVPQHLPCLHHKCPLAQPTCPHRYTLYAVVTHSGASIRHGHYRTYVRVPDGFNNHLAEYKRDQRGSVSSPCSFGDVPSDFTFCDTFISSTSKEPREKPFIDTFTNPKSFGSNGSQEPSSVLNQTECEAKEDRDFKGFSSLWVECDDDFIQVFDETEFFGKLSQSNGCLLGTPYVLFYHL